MLVLLIDKIQTRIVQFSDFTDSGTGEKGKNDERKMSQFLHDDSVLVFYKITL